MDSLSKKSGRSGKRRLMIALGSCVFGGALILLASQMGSKPENEYGAADGDAPAKARKNKTQRAWNIALGNVVIVAPDLGLNAKTLKGHPVKESRIATRLESQLQSLREFYRGESEKDPTLMGEMLLQITVNPSGDVTQVKELVSRISDTEFKRTVLAEAAKWTFPDIITDNTTITCPILFVREGMDISTIVQWEKTLGQFSEKAAIVKANTPAPQQKQAPESVRKQAPEGIKKTEAVVKAAATTDKAKIEQNYEAKSSRIYQVKHPTTIRREPNFDAESVGKFAAGARVAVIAVHGDWVEVRGDDPGLAGFIRREFVTSVELTQKTKSPSP